MKTEKEWIEQQEITLEEVSEAIEDLQKKWFMTTRRKEVLEFLKMYYKKLELLVESIKH